VLYRWDPVEGFDPWREFSKRCPSKYKDSDWVHGGVAHSQWAKVPKEKKNGVTLGSLFHWVSTDSGGAQVPLGLPQGTTYGEVKAKFEESHFKVKFPYALCTLLGKEVVVQKEKDFVGTYRNVYYWVRDKSGTAQRKPFVRDWLSDPNVKEYTKTDFLPPPQVCPVDVFNTYTGLRAEDLPPSDVDVSLVKEHVFNLCGRDPAVNDYFTKWLAHRVQKPGELVRTACAYLSVTARCRQEHLLRLCRRESPWRTVLRYD
jgi:hypothetical protein